MSTVQLWSAVLLLVNGLLLLIRSLYDGLLQLTGGRPWIQIILGVCSIMVALLIFSKGEGEKP